jgi:hypothetical protein
MKPCNRPPRQGARGFQLLGVVAAALLLAAPARADPPALKPELAGLAFLVGHWTASTRGQVQDTGGTSLGTTSFAPEADGAVLLRKDHVSLYDKAGGPAGGFDIIMMIYAEAGELHADYADGTHIIHYTSATLSPGRAVTFTSMVSPGAPTFRLAYALTAPRTLSIIFAVAPPGRQDFHPIASGVVAKDQ